MTYSITVTGKWLPVVNVWKHDAEARSCLQVLTAQTWAEAESFIRCEGGTVPARPAWAKDAP